MKKKHQEFIDFLTIHSRRPMEGRGTGRKHWKGMPLLDGEDVVCLFVYMKELEQRLDELERKEDERRIGYTGHKSFF